MSRNVRRKPQHPVKKEPLFRRGRPRNTYRRSRWKKEPKKFILGTAFFTMGLVFLGGISVALVVLYHLLLTSPAFCIKQNTNIHIAGLRRLTPETICQLAKVGPGTNLVALKPGQAERALLAHPWIAQAELTRNWPNGLHIRIQEREPVALVQMGELYYVDRQGTLFKPFSPGDPHDFPVITGLQTEHFQTGEAPPEILARTFRLMDLLKNTKSPLNLENISEIHVDLERGFTIYANGLGGGLDLGFSLHQDKLKKFARVWPVLVQKGYLARIGRINLDYPQRVLVSLRGMDETQ